MNEPDRAGVLRRLQSVEGHVRGIQRMVEEDKYCIDVIKQIDAVQAALRKVQEIRDHGFYQINYNMRRKPFDDLAIRKALAYGIPKTTILNQLVEGQGEVIHSMITPANEFWHNPNVEKYDLDLDRAKKVLADAGYTWDEKGAIYYPAGKTN